MPPKLMTMPMTAITTTPAVASILPSDTAARVEPPRTQLMTPKPAMVQRLRMTMIEVKW